MHLRGSWLVLIGNVQINFGAILHFTLYIISYLIDIRKCWHFH